MKQKPNQLKTLKLCYLFILLLTIIFVGLTHLFPIPYFMPFRFPHYLERMKPLSGISWPMTFEIYHYTLIIISLIFSFNILGLTFSKWREMAIFSSATGIPIFSAMILFFFFLFTQVNPPTAIIYGIYSLLLFIVNLSTLSILTGGKKMK